MTRRERLEARAERRRQWADGREAKSGAAFERARAIADGIPMGQPILVGHHSERRHRRDVGRIESGMAAGLEHGRAAEEHASRADGIEAQLSRSIYSDDADAVERLEEKIAELEGERDRIKAYNMSCRRGARDVSLLDEEQQEELASVARACPYQIRDNGAAPAYWSSNLSGNIRRNRERLEQIKRDNATRDAGGRGRGREMFSRFSSTCADCGGTIEKDSRIVYYRVTKEATHAECPTA
jgi:hypothetical protein